MTAEGALKCNITRSRCAMDIPRAVAAREEGTGWAVFVNLCCCEPTSQGEHSRRHMPVKTLHRQGLALLTCGLKCKPVVGRLMPHTSQPSNGPHTSLLSSKPRCSLPLLPSFLDKERWGGGAGIDHAKASNKYPDTVTSCTIFRFLGFINAKWWVRRCLPTIHSTACQCQ